MHIYILPTFRFVSSLYLLSSWRCISLHRPSHKLALSATQHAEGHPETWSASLTHSTGSSSVSDTILHTHKPSEQAKCNYGELLQLENLQSQLITISGTVHAGTSTLDWTFPDMSALLTVVCLPPLWPCFSFLFISEGCDWAILALFVTQPPSFFYGAKPSMTVTSVTIL